MANVTDTVESASEVMRREGTEWFGVLDGDRLLGWLWGTDLEGKAKVADCVPRQFRTTIQAAATLREALDAVVNTRNQAAVVLDGDRFRGCCSSTRSPKSCWRERPAPPRLAATARALTSRAGSRDVR